LEANDDISSEDEAFQEDHIACASSVDFEDSATLVSPTTMAV
jgi:hypothetical protein